MALRLGGVLPRLLVVVLIALLATATITFAAATRGGSASHPAAAPTVPTILRVPDVRRQAYVFAKSTLEEAGFAWRVTGSVRGYSANLVSAQEPAPGTRVYDTGAPTIVLQLIKNARYGQEGVPEDASSFPGTELRLVGVVVKKKAAPKKKVAPKHKAAPKKKVVPKPHRAKPKPQAKPKPHVQPKPKAKRPPAFQVPGARPEPLDEIPLPARALLLDKWLSAHRKPTNPNVKHWLYQHAWIVTGARLGWWRGADALELLIRVDHKVERQWGIGARSERVARRALAEVRRKSR